MISQDYDFLHKILREYSDHRPNSFINDANFFQKIDESKFKMIIIILISYKDFGSVSTRFVTYDMISSHANQKTDRKIEGEISIYTSDRLTIIRYFASKLMSQRINFSQIIQVASLIQLR